MAPTLLLALTVFIAVMMAIAVFLMIYLNQPIYPIIIGILIAVPGVV